MYTSDSSFVVIFPEFQNPDAVAGGNLEQANAAATSHHQVLSTSLNSELRGPIALASESLVDGALDSQHANISETLSAQPTTTVSANHPSLKDSEELASGNLESSYSPPKPLLSGPIEFVSGELKHALGSDNLVLSSTPSNAFVPIDPKDEKIPIDNPENPSTSADTTLAPDHPTLKDPDTLASRDSSSPPKPLTSGPPYFEDAKAFV